MNTINNSYTDSSVISQPNTLNLSLNSKVKELILCQVQFECSCPGKEVAETFQMNPLLPGVILTEQGKFAGIISQRQFLEIMSSPYGLELFSRRSLRSLYNFVHQEVLKLKGDVQIVEAARQSLQRTGKLVYEPIVIELEPEVYRLLDMHQLLLADSQIHQLTCQILNDQIDEQGKELKSQLEKISSMEPPEKMAIVGQIAASLSSEIRNPVYWVDTYEYLFIYCQKMSEILLAYESSIIYKSSNIAELEDQCSLDFILEYLPKTLKIMQESSGRMTKLTGSLQILLERLINISDGSTQQKRQPKS